MAYEVVVARTANENFGKALTYISEVLCVPRAAMRLLEAFETAVDSLEEYPAFFPVHREASDLVGREVRWRSVGEYRLYFVIDKEDRTVTVFSFLHRCQDALYHLRQDYQTE